MISQETGGHHPIRLGILLSGRGSNFLALHRAIENQKIRAEIALVLSNRVDAPGLEKASGLGLKTIAINHRGKTREQHDRLIVAALRAARVQWVCLAGYMRVLSAEFISAFPSRVLNIHPSLLPSFPGLEAQRQALDHGVRVSGCTVHLVDEGMDSGPIVVQRSVPVDDFETLESLSSKILEQEHLAYPEAIARLISEPWRVEGRRIRFRG